MHLAGKRICFWICWIEALLVYNSFNSIFPLQGRDFSHIATAFCLNVKIDFLKKSLIPIHLIKKKSNQKKKKSHGCPVIELDDSTSEKTNTFKNGGDLGVWRLCLVYLFNCPLLTLITQRGRKRTFCEPWPQSGTMQTWLYLIFTTTLRSKYYYSHFSDKEVEV